MNIYDDLISFDERINYIIDSLTIEQKVSQLMHESPAIPELNISKYNWWNESLHGIGRAGLATVFPQAIALGATFNPTMIKQMATIISDEGRAKYNEFSKIEDRSIYKGLNFWSPNINIFRDPRWGRGQETYGEDPLLTANIAVEFVKALQGDDEKYLKTVATPKHFYAHSGPEETRHSFNARITDYDKYNTYLYSFKKTIDAGAHSIMTAYNRVNDEPCIASSEIIQDLLRDEMSFKGLVVSDCGSMEDTHSKHRYSNTPIESCALSLKAGLDLECGKTYFHLLDALVKGMITENDINKALYRVFLTRFRLGEFDPNFTKYNDLNYLDVATDNSLEFSRKLAAESFVLLKNDGILPIKDAKSKTFLFVGPNTNSNESLLGNYSGTPKSYKTVLNAAQSQLSNIYYTEGCHLYKDILYSTGYKEDSFSESIILAKKVDYVIFAGGLSPELEGEERDSYNPISKSGDRTTLHIPEIQTKLLKKIREVNSNIIFLNFSGSPVDIEKELELCRASLQVWYPGGEGGEAIIDTLLGKRKPKGRLPVTFYNENSNIPEIENYDMSERTYKYMKEKPLFSFGYGLDYDEIEIKKASVKENCLKISFRGEGLTTLQIYTTNEKVKHNYRLAYFEKIDVSVTKEVEIALTKEMFGELDSLNETINYEGNNNIFISLCGIHEKMIEVNKYFK